MRIISALAFISIFLLSFAVLYFVSSRKHHTKKRLFELAAGTEKNATQKTKLTLLQKSLSVLHFGTGPESHLKHWLARAGYYGPQAIYDYYALKVASVIVLSALVAIASFYGHLPLPQVLLFVGLAVVVGALIPHFWISNKIIQRSEQIRRAVPNMLDLLVVCVEAGLSLTAAIQKLAVESEHNCPPLGHELHIVTREVLIGKSRGEAFRNLADRTGVPELRSLAITLIQADKLGTSVSKALRVLSESMRIKRRQRAEEMANKASVKLVFPLVFLIFPELLVVLLGPAMLNFLKMFPGVDK
ncbi:MAG: type II secretion system F family protein [candidate division Zixibacteria bacterium]|nr:type II secretion system F family protein [candidate division Zixibacteria bacterium]